jgi:2-oxoglutarate dehydrogenase E1 component
MRRTLTVDHSISSLANAEFLEELYTAWQEDPSSVPPEWDTVFRQIEQAKEEPAPTAGGSEIVDESVSSGNGADKTKGNGHGNGHVNGQGAAPAEAAFPSIALEASTREAFERPAKKAPDSEATMVYKQSRVDSLIWAYRDVGYIYADINPLSEYTTPELKYMYYTMEGNYETLKLEEFGLSEEDLDTEFYTGGYFEPKKARLGRLLELLKQTYCSTMGVEILHIQNKPMRRWLIEKIESPKSQRVWSKDRKVRFQKDLIKAEEFEHFVHANFIGQKRFSLEGAEALIPALRYLIDSAAEHRLQEIVLGMAHRGRLNMFTNALRKPGVETFSKFIDNYKPHTYGGTGDVKYHLGHSFDITTKGGSSIHVSMVANPSHLESVDPVVEGKTRGIQRRNKDWNRKKVLPVLIHGDASFSGQGVVAETFNLSQLKGYRTGGTVHIIVNNQIGFTTASRDARSTFFATDIAKSMPVPIFHANGDDPEAVVRAIDLAMRYRQKFGYDAVVDIMCYRRRGHNEADEPSFTHPIMYNMIKQHKSVTTLYGEKVAADGTYSKEEQDQFREKYRNVLKEELDKAKGGHKPNLNDAYERGEWSQFTGKYDPTPVETGVSKERLQQITNSLTTVPEGFAVHPKLKRFLKHRADTFAEGTGIDWAFAESLSFGSLLLEGYPIRLSGEDSGRGTFSQRHAVWWDAEAPVPKTHTPLRNLSPNQASFSVYDSPLSEFSVLGFDYGYSLAQPNILVIWEAQFGDFVNGGQVVIDQFISAGESKWFRSTGLVMFLPHGYEGQGPEHSSAHLERFLQLCADNNMQVVYPSTPAQLFHLLRRQMKQDFRKPLIVMTPKSLLRHKRCVSSVEDMTQGHYQLLLEDDLDPKQVDRLIFCSGKVYYDLLERREELEDDRTALVRLEQLYPFPREDVERVVGSYSTDTEVVWCQEESENRGAYHFVQNILDDILLDTNRRVRYVGRPPSPSPAAGSHKQHLEELENFLSEAFSHVARGKKES